MSPKRFSRERSVRWFLKVAIVLVGVMMPVSQAESGNQWYGLKIVSGLSDDCVCQRGADDCVDILVTGAAYPWDGHRVQWRVVRRRAEVKGLGWQDAIMLEDGGWRASIAALPVGGPYDVEFRLIDEQETMVATSAVRGVLVGDLWFMGGQSNMAGSGPMQNLEPPSEMVHCYSLGDEWVVAEDPLHLCSEGVYAVYRTSYVSPTERRAMPYRHRSDIPASCVGSGLGISFAKTVYAQTDVPIGLIAGALGGSTMDQWSRERRDEGENSLYWAMMKRIGDLGGRVRGIIWWQGESDAYNLEAGRLYEAKFRQFIADVRADLQDPCLPFHAVQLTDHSIQGAAHERAAGWNLVQDAQRRVMGELPAAGLVASLDLERIDAHSTSLSYRRIGRRLGRLVLGEVYGLDRYRVGPHLEAISFFRALHGVGLKLHFAGVNGGLQASSRVSGLSLRRRDGSSIGLGIYKMEIDPDDATSILIHTGIGWGRCPDDLELWYGWGTQVPCNVVDDADMALPAFGPIAVTLPGDYQALPRKL